MENNKPIILFDEYEKSNYKSQNELKKEEDEIFKNYPWGFLTNEKGERIMLTACNGHHDNDIPSFVRDRLKPNIEILTEEEKQKVAEIKAKMKNKRNYD